MPGGRKRAATVVEDDDEAERGNGRIKGAPPILQPSRSDRQWLPADVVRGQVTVEQLEAVLRAQYHCLWQKRNVAGLWETPPALRSALTCPFFLDRVRRRYVVIAVDPAGGGDNSQEAFVAFLVADEQVGSGRAPHGRRGRGPCRAPTPVRSSDRR